MTGIIDLWPGSPARPFSSRLSTVKGFGFDAQTRVSAAGRMSNRATRFLKIDPEGVAMFLQQPEEFRTIQ
jgi:hypothetical protein